MLLKFWYNFNQNKPSYLIIIIQLCFNLLQVRLFVQQKLRF